MVVVVSILQGIAPVYFTSKLHDQAFMRRDGSIVKMSPDVVVQRVTFGRRFEQKEQFDENSFLGRKEIILQTMDFLKQEVPTKVVIYYGLISVGKSSLAEYVRQKIMSDCQAFPI